MRNCKKDTVNITRGLAVRKALACVTSVVLAVGLMPGIALADDNSRCELDTQTNPVYVPYTDIYNDVKVNGDITITPDSNSAVTPEGVMYALNVNAVENYGDQKGEVTDSVSLEREESFITTVVANANKGQTSEVVVGSGNGGGVTTTSKYNGTAEKKGNISGVHAEVGRAGDQGSKANMTVYGDVNVQSADGYGANTTLCGVSANVVNGEANIKVNDVNVKASSSSQSLDAASGGRAVGVKVGFGSGAQNKATVLVDGTVSTRANGSNSAGVFLNNGAGTLDITVWKIDAGSGVVASSEEASGGFVEDKNLESKINYIIKVDQPKQGNILSLLGTTKKNVVVGGNTYSYDVANWGNGVNNKVYLQAAEGWNITGAYRYDDEGKTTKVRLEHDGGGWYVVVPNGGGVYLTAEVELCEYEMTFDLGGGMLDGKSTYTMAAVYGSTITLPTPVREGYEFLYWEGSRYYGGDSYKVAGPHSFRAIWKKKEPAPEPAAETKAAPASTGSSMPATGDALPLAAVTATLLVSAAALAVSRRKLEAAHSAKRGTHAR